MRTSLYPFFLFVAFILSGCAKESGPNGAGEGDSRSSVPVKVEIVSFSTVSAVIQWQYDQEGVDGSANVPLKVEIELSTDTLTFAVVKTITGDSTITSVPGTFDSTATYYFRLRSKSANSVSGYSSVVSYSMLAASAASAAGGEQVPVTGGTFVMGSPTGEGESNERPQHTVTLSDFSLGKYEVTRKLWREVVQWKQGSSVIPLDPDPSFFTSSDTLPVERVRWDDIQIWLAYLNERTGLTHSSKRFRLPTEAEWEYAARGGSHWKENVRYSGSDTVGTVAWSSENSGETTHVGGRKRPNQLGIYDMSGNVWEWCADRYGSYSIDDQKDPTGSTAGSFCIVRGGSWYLSKSSCTVANRNFNAPSWRGFCTGFRLCRTK